jgi:hypothetical protein
MSEDGLCIHCRKEVPSHLNFCDWDCLVQDRLAHGAKIHAPNGLPVRCTAGNLLVECEHGDHADYKFPITIDFIGDTSKFGFVSGDGNGGIVETPATPEEIEGFSHETHAVIYTDGYVVVTMNEHCYAMWSVRNGECWGGNLWKKGEWKINEESLKKLDAIAAPLRLAIAERRGR